MINAMKEYIGNTEGVGTVEIILILVVLIGLVLVFKQKITKLVEKIFKEINETAEDIYG